MARIFLSAAGEGRGHATRARALAEALRGRHELSIYAPGHAYDLLAPSYAGGEVRVERIPGVATAYAGRRFDLFGTARNALRYARGVKRLIDHLAGEIRARRPDLIVSDFEPALPRAAARCGVPYVSVDHQHFAVVSDLSELPASLRRKLWLIRLVARVNCPKPAHRVVSSFYFPPLKSKWRDVTQVGVLLRPEVLEAELREGEHLVVYLRRFAPEKLLDALASLDREVRVYGLARREDRGALRFRELDARAFVEDLAGSRALVSTAGNQIVGEALYLRKPVLAMPEAGNFEQCINAHFLAAEGVGEWVPLEECGLEQLRGFCERVPELRARIDPRRFDGTRAAVAAVERELRKTRRPAAAPPARPARELSAR